MSGEDDEEEEEEEEEEDEEPYEKVRIRITFPLLSEYSNQLELERWIPWDQVYEDEGDDASAVGGDRL